MVTQTETTQTNGISTQIALLPGADRVLETVLCGELADQDAYQLSLLAQRLLLMAGFDELICLDELTFTPFDYQIRAAQTVLRRFRGRGLLCDEVGLGKTIEAALVLKEYLMRSMIERVLIIAPPGLVEQWRDELASKFLLTDFITSADPTFRDLGSDAWERFPRVIASLATARRPEHRRVITNVVYDLVIVDEAHHLKNRSSVSWKFVNALQKKYILLLTATPVQNRLDELYNLITVLKPGQLKTPREFAQHFVVSGDPRLPKNRGRLRELLMDVMVRHSRGQISLQLPPRRAHTVRLELSSSERALYNAVSIVVRNALAQTEHNDDSSGISPAQRFGLITLQREVGSSAQATRETLTSLAKGKGMKPWRTPLLDLAKRAAAINTSSKAEALKKILEAQLRAADGKVIVFTHFRATLDMLAQNLSAWGIDFVCYQGGLSLVEKENAIRRFENEVPVLLSTEAAGEGRNLQFCRVMVNFDLPWNPMRIEQRVGRIHRVGQDRPVDIFNLSAKDTIEDYILDILDRKLNMFELVIGEVDMVLGQLADERDFEDIVFDVWARSQTPAELQANMDALGDTLTEARNRYQKIQVYDEALFGEDFSTE